MKKNEFKKWLESVYNNDRQNTIFEAYNDYKDCHIKDCSLNFKRIILKDDDFIKYAMGNIEVE